MVRFIFAADLSTESMVDFFLEKNKRACPFIREVRVIVAIDSVDKSAAKMNLTTSSANIIQGMTDEGEHLVLITNFHFYMQWDTSWHRF